MLFDMLLFMATPLLIATGLLAIGAHLSWRQTMDRILRGMKDKEVQRRVEDAAKHRKWAKYHAIVIATGILTSMVFTIFGNDVLRSAYDPLAYYPGYMFIWGYGLFIPHMLALLLYHIRWNPKTLQRKQKLDAQDAIYEGNYDLDPDARYRVNDEGELIQLAMQDEVQQMQQS